jgi:hypothetical protein
VDRAEQRFNPVEESKVPTESKFKSLRDKGNDVKSGDNSTSSGWNG